MERWRWREDEDGRAGARAAFSSARAALRSPRIARHAVPAGGEETGDERKSKRRAERRRNAGTAKALAAGGKTDRPSRTRKATSGVRHMAMRSCTELKAVKEEEERERRGEKGRKGREREETRAMGLHKGAEKMQPLKHIIALRTVAPQGKHSAHSSAIAAPSPAVKRGGRQPRAEERGKEGKKRDMCTGETRSSHPLEGTGCLK